MTCHQVASSTFGNFALFIAALVEPIEGTCRGDQSFLMKLNLCKHQVKVLTQTLLYSVFKEVNNLTEDSQQELGVKVR